MNGPQFKGLFFVLALGIFWKMEPPEVRARIQRNYEIFKKAYEEGMREKRAREAANGGIDPWFKQV